jgi:hypothetical protein
MGMPQLTAGHVDQISGLVAQHKPGILRRIPFTGERIQTKKRRKITFNTLGALREQERVD